MSRSFRNGDFERRKKDWGEDEFYQKWKSLDYMRGIEINKYRIRVTIC